MIDNTERAGRCEATGLPFTILPGGSGKSPFAPSVDRIDPAGPYSPENSRVVVSIYNLAKNAWGDADVLLMAEALCAR